jgi:trans-2-enoyl-CoA reductase
MRKGCATTTLDTTLEIWGAGDWSLTIEIWLLTVESDTALGSMMARKPTWPVYPAGTVGIVQVRVLVAES